MKRLVKTLQSVKLKTEGKTGGAFLYKALAMPEPGLSVEWLGAILEEELLVHEQGTYGSDEASWKAREEVLGVLLEHVYKPPGHGVEAARMLLERACLARLQCLVKRVGILEDLRLAVNLLKEHVTPAGNQRLTARDEYALSQSILALFLQETQPDSQEVVTLLGSACAGWRSILETPQPDRTLQEHFRAYRVSTSTLLAAADMLALHGHCHLLRDVLQVAVSITASAQGLSLEEAKRCLLEGTRSSHLFCPASFPSHGIERPAPECSCSEGPSPSGRSSVENETCTKKEGSSKRELLQQAARLHAQAERQVAEGQLDQAQLTAMQAFQIRYSLFYHFFGNGPHSKSSESKYTDDSSTTESTQGPKAHLGGWERLLAKDMAAGAPILQWRVLGDYLESLFQVGRVLELSGSVNEGQQSFQQGKATAEAWGLTFIQATFQSALGEVQRKRRQWGVAAEGLEAAAAGLASGDCSPCKKLAAAQLHRRLGDLNRRRPSEQELEASLRIAMEHYKEAKALLAALLPGVDICCTAGAEGRELLEVPDMVCESGSASSVVTVGSAKPGERKGVGSKGRGSKKAAALEAADEGESKVTAVVRRRKAKQEPVLSEQSEVCEGGDGSKSTKAAVTRRTRRAKAEEEVAAVVKAAPARRTRARKKVQADLEECIDGATAVRKCARLSDAGETLVSVGPGGRQGTAVRLAVQQGEACVGEGEASGAWTRAATEELARVLLQEGKCKVLLGDLDGAEQCFIQGLGLARTESDKESQLSTPSKLSANSRRDAASSHPFAEAALCCHLAQLHLRRNWDSSNKEPTAAPLRLLHRAFSLCHLMPPVLRNVASQLAALYSTPLGCSSPASTPPYGKAEAARRARLGAFFHQAAAGASTRLQHQAVLDAKVASAGQDQVQENVRHGLERVRQALRVPPCDLEEADDVATFFQRTQVDTLPAGMAVVSLSVLRSTAGEGPSLLISRVTAGKRPVAVRVRPNSWQFESWGGQDGSMIGASSSDRSAYDELSSEEEGKAEGGVVKGAGGGQAAVEMIMEGFGKILEESRRSTTKDCPVETKAQKSRWWQWRMALDQRLCDLVEAMEGQLVGPWKCLLLGELSNPGAAGAYLSAARQLVDKLTSAKDEYGTGGKADVDSELVRLLLQGAPELQVGELCAALADLLGWPQESAKEAVQLSSSDCSSTSGESSDEEGTEEAPSRAKALLTLAQAFKQAAATCAASTGEATGGRKRAARSTRSKKRAADVEGSATTSFYSCASEADEDCASSKVGGGGTTLQRGVVELVLDSELQALPWESLPVLSQQRVYRMPSLSSVHALLCHLEGWTSSQGKAPPVRKGKGRPGAELGKEALFEADLGCTFYTLNPGGDLPATQAAFEGWFRELPGWKGIVGQPPRPQEYAAGLEGNEVFVYFGHGGGEQFLKGHQLRKLDRCAVSLLMGCSSGQLLSRGDYEPTGIVKSYAMAGCPVVIANLWDVTDGDIDRFSRCVLDCWLEKAVESGFSDVESLGSSAVSVSAREARKDLGASQGKVQACSGGHNSCASEEGLRKGGTACVSTAVRTGRGACRLRFLIGAAPVCYGVPTKVISQ